MAFKSMILISILVTILAATTVKAQLGLLGGLININGNLFCSPTGNVVANSSTPTPPFPNALVQVSCGGNIISSAITNGSGLFNIVMNPLQFLLSNVLSGCNLVVASPLSSCNPSLSTTGLLQSPLQLVGTTVRGLLSIVNLIPLGFQLL